jgi:hypothetical protein
MSAIARGLSDFQVEVAAAYDPFGTVLRTKCGHVSELVPAMQKIELALEEFFTIRTTLRLLIAHCIQLETATNGLADTDYGLAYNELLVRIPDHLRMKSTADVQAQHVGAICLNTSPSLILIEAYRHARRTCLREQDRCSDLLINEMPFEEYLSECAFNSAAFPYVDIHLYFVFFEVLRNALITSFQKAAPQQDLEPIHATLISGTSLLADNERAVKISDFGEGIRREDRTRVWSYFYSSRHSIQSEKYCRECNEPSEVSDDVPRSISSLALDFVQGAPAAVCICGAVFTEDCAFCRKCGKMRPETTTRFHGHGLGLPVSRALVRYFGGEIDINSMHRKGTDVHIYL